MALPTFGFVTAHERPLPDGVACEAQWMAGAAAHGRALAHLWEGAPGLVVPRSYARPAPDLSMLSSAERPIVLRALDPVPQGRWQSCTELINRLSGSLEKTPAAKWRSRMR